MCVWVRDGMLATYISLKHIYAWFGLKGSIYFCLAKKLIFRFILGKLRGGYGGGDGKHKNKKKFSKPKII